VEDLLPLGAVHVAPHLQRRVEADLVEPGLREAAHVLAAARDTRVEVGVVVLAELVFQQFEVPGRLRHRLLRLAAGDRGAERAHALGLLDHVGIGLDLPLVGVHVGDVLPVLSEGAVEAVPLVAVAVDEQHHLPALGALFTALGDHLPLSTGCGLKKRPNRAVPGDPLARGESATDAHRAAAAVTRTQSMYPRRRDGET